MEILLIIITCLTATAIFQTGRAAQRRVSVERERSPCDSTFHRTNVYDDRC